MIRGIPRPRKRWQDPGKADGNQAAENSRPEREPPLSAMEQGRPASARLGSADGAPFRTFPSQPIAMVIRILRPPAKIVA